MGVAVILDIIGQSGIGQQTFNDTIHANILPNDSAHVDITYIAPSEQYYYVGANAYLISDSALVNADASIQECADKGGISIIITKPQQDETHTAGDIKEIEILIKNESNVNYTSIQLTVQIECENKIVDGPFWGTVYNLNANDSIFYTFDSKYTVPECTKYIIKAFMIGFGESDTVWGEYFVDIVGIAQTGHAPSVRVYPNPTSNQLIVKIAEQVRL